MTRTCKKLGCDREATLAVEVNAPGRGHGVDHYCLEHGRQKRGQRYVREVRALDAEEGADVDV